MLAHPPMETVTVPMCIPIILPLYILFAPLRTNNRLWNPIWPINYSYRDVDAIFQFTRYHLNASLQQLLVCRIDWCLYYDLFLYKARIIEFPMNWRSLNLSFDFLSEYWTRFGRIRVLFENSIGKASAIETRFSANAPSADCSTWFACVRRNRIYRKSPLALSSIRTTMRWAKRRNGRGAVRGILF